MSPIDRALLTELEKELNGKLQKLVFAAYLKNPTAESVVKVALKILERTTQKNED